MKKYDIAAFVWPSYTGDEPRTRIFWPEGIGEWQTVRDANEEKDGKGWPKLPAAGFVNEADPKVMEEQIKLAASHGVNVFIYDWYWYDRRPFLENCLNDGFLGAKNNADMQFYLMWANHDATNLWDTRNSHDLSNVIWEGKQGEEEFLKIAARLIEKYFTKPNYYKIDGKPVFMIYEIRNLVNGLGGIKRTRAALKKFDKLARRAGFAGVHFQYVRVKGDFDRFAGEVGYDGNEGKGLRELGYSSLTHYQFVHFTDFSKGALDYEESLPAVAAEYEAAAATGLPYFPHVSMGWDPNPRFRALRPDVLLNNTPAAFEKALRMAKDYADRHPEQPPLITLNAWNEWTEGSYLEPDTVNGTAYLDAVKKVFCEE